MASAVFFAEKVRGETIELKAALHEDSIKKKLTALKRIIACATLGKDMSALFSSVLNCAQTENLELKKLAYLYLTFYAHRQPDEAVMIVNTIIKDCADTRPLVRAIAVRTLGCLRVPTVIEHLADSLRLCLKDEDPYVRKISALCVSKLYRIHPDLIYDLGFVEMIQELTADVNCSVMTNAIVALSEVKTSIDFSSTPSTRLLCALGECNEWGQVYMLEALSQYQPVHEWEVRSMAERVAVHLAHANAAVVLTAVRILLRLLTRLPPELESTKALINKLSPPLATLLSSEPEIQYVALRNISIIIQKHPDLFKNELRMFFVKYNDPVYVKFEKLEIMVQLASESNVSLILSELKEYATEVDIDFVRTSIRAIGRCAIKLEGACQNCIITLLALINTGVEYILNESIIVFRDIFRRYPNKYEGVLSNIVVEPDTIVEPKAKTALVWIIGEYGERIEEAVELLDSIGSMFHEQRMEIQLAILTSSVKLFLKRPEDSKYLVQYVLQAAIQSNNPDVRDRAFIYWRLLSTDPGAAKIIVLSEKPPITEDVRRVEENLLTELLRNIGNIASVLHKPPSSFLETPI